MHWEQTPTGHRCTRPGHVDEHGRQLEFRTGEVCGFCTADPGSPLTDLDARPERDNRLLADAAELRTVARTLRARAADMLDDGPTDREAVAAAQLYAEARKSLVDAAKLEAPILRREHTRFLVEERRRMHGHGGRN